MIFYLFLEMVLIVALCFVGLAMTHPIFLIPATVLGVVVALEAL